MKLIYNIRLLDIFVRSISAFICGGFLFAMPVVASPGERSDIPFPFVQDDIGGVLLRGIVNDENSYESISNFADLARQKMETFPEIRFPMILLSVGSGAIIGDTINPEYLGVFPANVPEVFSTFVLESNECNIESVTGSNGATLLWVAVDSDLNSELGGVRFAEHCVYVAILLSLGVDLFEVSGLTTDQATSLILEKIS